MEKESMRANLLVNEALGEVGEALTFAMDKLAQIVNTIDCHPGEWWTEREQFVAIAKHVAAGLHAVTPALHSGALKSSELLNTEFAEDLESLPAPLQAFIRAIADSVVEDSAEPIEGINKRLDLIIYGDPAVKAAHAAETN